MLFSKLNTSRFLRFVVVVTPLVLFSIYILHTNWDPFRSSFSILQSSKCQHNDIDTPTDTNSTLNTSYKEPSLEDTPSDVPNSNPQPLPTSFAGETISAVTSAISGIPKKVWQTAKVNTLSEDQRGWSNSWTEKNPSFRLELLTDRSSETFVRTHYLQARPDIVEVYEALLIPILRADLLRYLMVLAEGGVWSDLDATCDKEVLQWVPAEYRHHKIDMIVGLEFDFEWRGEGTQVASQFTNWVFAAQPSSRNLQIVVDAVVDMIKDIAWSNGVPVAGLTMDMLPIDVVDVTGPKIMTIQILKSLGQLLGRPVDDRDFSGIKQPKLIGDVLIMPGNAFAAIQNGFPDDQGDILVTHHYEGSWKQADAEAKERKKQQMDNENKASGV
ncbi:hypothetical protein BGW36DRAFT_387449 [Talaromyces proteolyticus]|uniref:Initiation-specific alpha-1,6-mannosyltransferase n=1 Tax=Talaromyces proteolyticus TaxID=1131652 RepID=A0AAD4PWF2_9EURO|nr:uncharacterized protein BGW36DRAFT_387449 [Talaromyces proteolyticus]KAH8692353.1 hypothetical protein BGW36DRAFT_387449 [Talaromyces proteolyticus]